jgi:hypothetical protein
MDHFGIGAGVKGAVGIYFAASRRTGRTTSLVESVKDGDCVVFTDSRMGKHFKDLCRDRGVTVEIVVVDPKRPEGLFEHDGLKGFNGRTILDHHWVEEFYRHEIDRLLTLIDRFERETSGYGEAHRETKRRALEIRKFDGFF